MAIGDLYTSYQNPYVQEPSRATVTSSGDYGLGKNPTPGVPGDPIKTPGDPGSPYTPDWGAAFSKFMTLPDRAKAMILQQMNVDRANNPIYKQFVQKFGAPAWEGGTESNAFKQWLAQNSSYGGYGGYDAKSGLLSFIDSSGRLVRHYMDPRQLGFDPAAYGYDQAYSDQVIGRYGATPWEGTGVIEPDVPGGTDPWFPGSGKIGDGVVPPWAGGPTPPAPGDPAPAPAGDPYRRGGQPPVTPRAGTVTPRAQEIYGTNQVYNDRRQQGGNPYVGPPRIDPAALDIPTSPTRGVSTQGVSQPPRFAGGNFAFKNPYQRGPKGWNIA